MLLFAGCVLRNWASRRLSWSMMLEVRLLPCSGPSPSVASRRITVAFRRISSHHPSHSDASPSHLVAFRRIAVAFRRILSHCRRIAAASPSHCHRIRSHFVALPSHSVASPLRFCRVSVTTLSHSLAFPSHHLHTLSHLAVSLPELLNALAEYKY